MNDDKTDNLGEMEKFLKMYNLPRLSQEEIENINIQITSNEIESVILKPSTSKNPNQMISWVKSTKYLEKNEYLFFSNYYKNCRISSSELTL